VTHCKCHCWFSHWSYDHTQQGVLKYRYDMSKCLYVLWLAKWLHFATSSLYCGCTTSRVSDLSDSNCTDRSRGLYGSKRIQGIQQWSEKWQIRFNGSKCKTCTWDIITNTATTQWKSRMLKWYLNRYLNQYQLKDLGVWIDDKLKFSSLSHRSCSQ